MTRGKMLLCTIIFCKSDAELKKKVEYCRKAKKKGRNNIKKGRIVELL